ANGVPDDCEAGRWIGANGASFTAPANWTPAGVPSTAAVLTNTAAVDNRRILSASGATNLCALTVSAIAAGKQILEIDPGSPLTASGSRMIANGGQLAVQGGTLAGGAVTNASNTITGYGRITASITNQGVIRADPIQSLDLAGASLTNQASAT